LEKLTRAITNLFGDEGIAWLARLPGLIAEIEARWDVTVGPPLPDLSFNYVAPAVTAGGEQGILKLGVPHRELASEIGALRLYDGRGAARLLAADAELGALLLERLQPGTPAYDLHDEEQVTAIAADVMRRLWRPLPPEHDFTTVADWAAGLGRLRARFGGGTGPFPAALVERAEGLFAELFASEAEPVLLHGDLHHWNILATDGHRSTGGSWSAIDPKGVAGEPAFEPVALLHNPWGELLDLPDPARLQARRVALLSEMLGLDRERVAAWGLAGTVLSAWWSLEDGFDDWPFALGCAELLVPLT